MTDSRKSRFFLKILLWFIFLSTLGVGGGIFFLLFAVVPIEQIFTDRGWSQFKIDNVMKYFVFGWVIFGFILSFLYYYLIVKRDKWLLTWLFATGAVALCVLGVYYFLHTGSGIVQSSQGDVVEGERFTFGPYPEKEDLIRLKEQGYDGVITLLSSALPIEKPLLEQEKKNGEDASIEVLSLPMLPWVGDNTASIEKVKELIQQDDKKYYVHCYLGKHRVDVVKQVINEAIGDDYEVRFLQPTTLERGNLFYYPGQSVLIGPYPTDEEWFTRIKRAEVEEIVSLLRKNKYEKFKKYEQKITGEIDLVYTQMPMPANPGVSDIQKVADYIKKTDRKVYVYDFKSGDSIEMLSALLEWEKTLTGDIPPQAGSMSSDWIGRRFVIGGKPSNEELEKLKIIGVEEVVPLENLSVSERYKAMQTAISRKQLTHFTVNSEQEKEQAKTIAVGLLIGSETKGKEFHRKQLANGQLIRHERNLLLGPVLEAEEYETFAQTNGISRIIYMHSPSITNKEKLEEMKRAVKDSGIPMQIVSLVEHYEDRLLPLIEEENGMNYIMAEPEVLSQVQAYIKKF